MFMCGIIGYIGSRQAAPLLLKGLERLEYRGYDSAGIAVGGEVGLDVRKLSGKVADLAAYVSRMRIVGTIGIGHTRWATHGEPSERNAHPHLSQQRKIAVVHNGIVENCDDLRIALSEEGFHFATETDTEVFPHLIDREMRKGAATLEEAVARALQYVEGAYAIAVLSSAHPNEIVAARNSSELLIGIGEGEFFLASDESALAEHVRFVAHIDDGGIVTLPRRGAPRFRGLSTREVEARIKQITISVEDIDRGGHPHFMRKEIAEQPRALRNALRGRLDPKTGEVVLGGFTPEVERAITQARRVVMVGCGTSLYAGLAGKMLIESLARLPVEVAYASEYQYQNPIVGARDVVIGISQSGTTADTIGALRLAKERGALILGITNKVGSSLSRMVAGGVYLHAGPEYAVASTKAFTSQVAVLALIALKVASLRDAGDKERRMGIAAALHNLPDLVEEALGTERQMEELAREYKTANRFLVLGRKFAVPLALEGALKLKEIGYLDAEGYPAGELKHGPLALVEKSVPVIALVRRDSVQEKTLSNLAEVVTRSGSVIALTTRGDERPKRFARHIIELPDTVEEFTAIIAAPPLQLLAYHIGLLRGNNVDKPRNLAKSVTVE